jgi:hypothetical protein
MPIEKQRGIITEKQKRMARAFYWRRFNASLRVWALMQRTRGREIVWNKEIKEWVWR